MNTSKQAPPLVSVVIPAYKARNYLAECLASVAAQTLPPLEILLIDDKSPEPIDDIVDDYRKRAGAPPVRVIRHRENAGLGAARNTGIQEATGEWIALLDHDDLWAPEHLELLASVGEERQVDVAFCPVKQFKEDPGDSLGIWGPVEDEDFKDLAVKLYFRCFITPSATLIRRSMLMELGGFNDDPRVHMCEDLDLWLRLIENGGTFACSRPVTVYYRKHPEAATLKPGYMACQSAYVRELHAGKIRGHWFKKRSAIAVRWWRAWLMFLTLGKNRPELLARAIWTSIPVPWEMARGLVRFRRVLRAGKIEFGES